MQKKYISGVRTNSNSISNNFIVDYGMHPGIEHSGPPSYGDEIGGDETPGKEIQRNSVTPFAISVLNPEISTAGFNTIDDGGSVDPDAQYVRSNVLSIRVNRGTAVCKQKQLAFNEEFKRVQFDSEGVTAVYAEVELRKENFAFSRISNHRIKFTEPSTTDFSSYGHRRITKDFIEIQRQLIGTVAVSKVNEGFKVNVSQIVQGDFTFGDPDIGTLSDLNGIDTTPGVKEFIVTIDDKLYNADIEVLSLKAVQNTGDS